jgi:hypothetical protein
VRRTNLRGRIERIESLKSSAVPGMVVYREDGESDAEPRARLTAIVAKRRGLGVCLMPRLCATSEQWIEECRPYGFGRSLHPRPDVNGA